MASGGSEAEGGINEQGRGLDIFGRREEGSRGEAAGGALGVRQAGVRRLVQAGYRRGVQDVSGMVGFFVGEGRV